jgi:orotidine-5'-phosphate decarboxylase
VLVGLDPRLENLPPGLLPAEHAHALTAQARAYQVFCEGVIDVVAPYVPAVKPQAAFFEQLGPPGMEALAAVIGHAQRAGLLVILDGKRNDIGTTAAAYAAAYLGAGDRSAWGAHALTVSPYLGADSLEPFVEVARQREAGIFILVKTSNPGGGLFQDPLADGRPIYQHVAAFVEGLAHSTSGSSGYGDVGAVVGATYPQQLAELRQQMPHAWLLIPGFGAQGGTAQDVASAFDAQGRGAVVNNSRGIIFAHERKEYRERFGPQRWQAAVEQATLDMIEQLAAHTPAGRLRA